MNPDIENLNRQFGIAQVLNFAGVNGLPVIEIATAAATARIAIQGGQLLEWQPAGQQPVIWVSRAAVYQAGKGVRGGVPVCWPWFGAGEAGKPAHGFVRTRMWQVRATGQDGHGVFVRLGIKDDVETHAIWDHAFDLELIVHVGARLSMELITHNTGGETLRITDALHTYFRIGDIGDTEVLGLDQTVYQDKVSGQNSQVQTGPVVFAGETDRIYLDTQADCVIKDERLGRRIRIAKQGSDTTVVWNPWTEKEKTFPDMSAGEYRDMLCVETCNAANDVIVLQPGEKHSLRAELSVE
ncbi:MAG: D-hexose-6-phosphate mutarotase [Burkholderiales bacterium]